MTCNKDRQYRKDCIYLALAKLEGHIHLLQDNVNVDALRKLDKQIDLMLDALDEYYGDYYGV